MHGKPTALGAASGAVAGLVAITPAAGFVGPVSAVIIGLIGGVLCLLAINLKNKFKYDDALDVVAVHGCGGTWGLLPQVCSLRQRLIQVEQMVFSLVDLVWCLPRLRVFWLPLSIQAC